MKKRMMWCVAAAAAVMIVVSACASGLRQTKGAGKGIAYTVAQRYFLNGDVRMSASAKVDNEADFNRLFGMATVMGPDGQPTPIDFARSFAIFVALPETDRSTDITPGKLTVAADGTLRFAYRVKRGDKRSYTIRPLLLIFVDKAYAGRKVVTEEI